MVVGIDGKPLLSARTGIGVYTHRILTGVVAAEAGLSARVYLPLPLRCLWERNEARRVKGSLEALYPERTTFVATRIPPQKARRWLWQASDLLPMERTLGAIDLFHATDMVMPPLRRAKGVLTVYDLSFMLFPEYHVGGMQAFTRNMRRFAGRADAVIAISEHTKRDVVELLGVPPERVRVTLLAADERYRVLEDRLAIAEVAARYGIDGPYVLYTGTLEPRKNIPTLVRAFHTLKRETRIPHRLVLAGKKGWLYDEIFAEVARLGLDTEVIFTGFVADEDLPYLYNGADLFVYPSFYEGFGLPPLEAMACGCPVVTSTTSSLPEVVGEAGLMVDPHDATALAEAMARALGDGDLHARMREKGLARAARFSWEQCVAETLTLYRELVGG